MRKQASVQLVTSQLFPKFACTRVLVLDPWFMKMRFALQLRIYNTCNRLHGFTVTRLDLEASR